MRRATAGAVAQVLVKRLAFRDTIEEAVLALHAKIKSGELTLPGGQFPTAALKCLREHGVTQPHTADGAAPLRTTQRRRAPLPSCATLPARPRTERASEEASEDAGVARLRRYSSGNKRNLKRFATDGGYDYGRSLQTRPCTKCGGAVEVPGTSIWWGRGCLSWLEGDTRDNPPLDGWIAA